MNLSGAETQVQGSIIDGLSSAGLQEIILEEGRVAQSNFHDYPQLRMNEAPVRVDVHFLRCDFPPISLGEPALSPLSPASDNAVFAPAANVWIHFLSANTACAGVNGTTCATAHPKKSTRLGSMPDDQRVTRASA